MRYFSLKNGVLRTARQKIATLEFPASASCTFVPGRSYRRYLPRVFVQYYTILYYPTSLQYLVPDQPTPRDYSSEAPVQVLQLVLHGAEQVSTGWF